MYHYSKQKEIVLGKRKFINHEPLQLSKLAIAKQHTDINVKDDKLLRMLYHDKTNCSSDIKPSICNPIKSYDFN